MRFSSLIIATAKTVFLLACFILGINVFYFWYGTQHTYVYPDDPFAKSFPVVIVYPDEQGKNVAEVVYMSDLASTTSIHPQHSFLISPAEEKTLNDITDIHDRGLQSTADFRRDTPWPWLSGFTILQNGEGEQHIEAWRTEDDDRENTSWYVATRDKVVPERHRFYFAGGAGILAFPAGILSALAGFALLVLWKKFRTNNLPAKQATDISS